MAERGRGLRGGPRGGRGGDRSRGNIGSHGRGDGGRGGPSSPSLPFHSRGGRPPRGGRGPGRGPRPETPIFRGATREIPSVDSSVRDTEDKVGAKLEEFVKNNQGKLEREFPNRPGYGSKGTRVQLWANYFHLEVDENLKLHKYRIEVAPEAKGRKLHRIIEIFIQDHLSKDRLGIATDYKRTLISTGGLTVQQEYRVKYRDEGADGSNGNGNPYRVSVHHDSTDGNSVTISVSELLNYLGSLSATALYAQKETAIQALNIIIGHHPKSVPRIASIGANKHFAMSGGEYERADLGEGLECLRGFFVSTRSATCRILLNIQVKHAAMVKPGYVSDIIDEVVSQKAANKAAKTCGFLARVRVELTHLEWTKSGGKIRRIKTIYGLAHPQDGRDRNTGQPVAGCPNPPQVNSFGDNARNVKFYLQDPPQGSGLPGNTYTSVYDYYKRVYNHQCSGGSVLNVGTRERPTYVPPELCRILPGQPAGVKLTPGQTLAMTRFSIRPPVANANTIVQNGPKRLGLAPLNGTVNAFSIKTTNPPNMITVDARILVSPSVVYRGDKKLEANDIRDAGWNLISVKFARGAHLKSWSFLSLRQNGVGSHHNQYQAYFQAFQKTMRDSGIQVDDFKGGDSVNFDANWADQSLRDIFDKRSKLGGPHLLVVILPSKDVSAMSLYNKIKVYGDVEFGVHTVCMTVSNLQDQKPGTFANISLKVNTKLGGMNHTLASSHCSLIRQGKTMVVGLDVTHPSPTSLGMLSGVKASTGAQIAPSITAMVASKGQDLAQWPVEFCLQDQAREETVEATLISDLLKTRLTVWRNANGRLPENILVYRDGVSETQYEKTINKELEGMRQACKETYTVDQQKQGLPRFSVIIVGKRHHTRFYVTEEKNTQGRLKNTKPGTVVDRGVTEAHNWDFFLQPHAAIQGTARPAHYFVICDEIFRDKELNPTEEKPADMLERLTHEMSYLYVRATKAVSVCPPAYYADLACERARDYLAELYDPSTDVTPATTDSGIIGADRDALTRRITPHPNLKDTMFYI